MSKWQKGKFPSHLKDKCFQKGHIPTNKGIPCPEWQKEYLRNIHKGKHYSPETELKSGPLNPFWRGGVTEFSRGVGWQHITKDIKERDKYTCLNCNQYKGRLSIHHIIPYRISKDNSYSNLITLCTSCHITADNLYDDFGDNEEYWLLMDKIKKNLVETLN